VVSPVWMAQAENYFYSTWGREPIGYTVALMKDGRLLGASSVGYAKSSADGSVRLTNDAQWDFLSDSKWITSLAAAKVAEEQGVNINTNLLVKDIAPQLGLTWQNTGSTTDFWHITNRQAMTHTSNLYDGGCDNGPLPSNWDVPPGPALQKPGGSGWYSYSGYDACMLRVWVEVRTGMPFERYVDTHLFRPNGIHDLDCLKDSDKTEVLQYMQPGDTNPGRSEPNTYCAAAGFKGSPLQMLQILQMARVPGRVLGQSMLDSMRVGTTNAGDEWTFYQSAFDVDNNGMPDAFGYSMTGGRLGMVTHIAQFPTNPFDGSAPFTTAAYASGIDAVFFTNSGPGSGYLVQWSSMQADPNP
jgi:CubicO group peptidase (beta-lactamase class C family)